jgi:hypothetical protein
MTVMRAILDLSEATRGEVGLEALRAASNAAQIQQCLTLQGLCLRIGRSGVRLSQRGFQPSGLKPPWNRPCAATITGHRSFSAPC